MKPEKGAGEKPNLIRATLLQNAPHERRFAVCVRLAVEPECFRQLPLQRGVLG